VKLLHAATEAQRAGDRGRRDALLRQAPLCMEAATEIERWTLPEDSSPRRRRRPVQLLKATPERSG